MVTQNEPSSRRKLLPILKDLWYRYVVDHFETFFILVTLLSIGTISYFVHDKLALLNFYFIPVLLAGYFLDTRSAVLGSVLSICWVLFFVVLKPESFYIEHDKLGLYLHLVTWGSFLVLCGALVGRLNEQLQDKIARLKCGLDDWKGAQRDLLLANTKLEEKGAALEAMSAKLESTLYSTMDPAIAQMIINKNFVNERKEITVLCSDLANFSPAVENLKPETVVSELNRVFARLDPIISAYRGHHDKIIGDRLLAEFSMPRPAAHSALQTVLAGLKMQEKLARGEHRWRMRVGISHGDAVVGLVGSEHRKSYTALGDVVNRSYLLQAACPEGSVCVDEATHEKIKPYFLTRRIFADRASVESASLERRLKTLEDKMPGALDAGIFLEAGKISLELGDAGQGVLYYRQAMAVDPACRAQAERSLAAAALNPEAAVVSKSQRLRAFEVIQLKNPLADPKRVPKSAGAFFTTMAKTEGLDPDLLLPIESLDASIGHSRVAAALAAYLAESMGLDDDLQQAAFLAGFFHDVALRGTSDEDRQAHPLAARAALAEMGVPLPETALEAIEQHHEDFDGGGYPRHLGSARISLLARILRIVDEYATLTAYDPSRETLDQTTALAELKAQAALGKLDYKILAHFSKALAI